MIATAQTLVYIALYLVVFVLSAWALLDAVARPASAFVNAGKRTKRFWLLVTGAATAVSFIALPPLGRGGFLVIIAAVAAGVYLADVRPAVKPYSGGRGGRGGRGGGTPPSRGGW